MWECLYIRWAWSPVGYVLLTPRTFCPVSTMTRSFSKTLGLGQDSQLLRSMGSIAGGKKNHPKNLFKVSDSLDFSFRYPEVAVLRELALRLEVVMLVFPDLALVLVGMFTIRREASFLCPPPGPE